ncbi:hypothetical protein, partial [Fictibacillus sp. NRS-1165]|uniref:hypothetical protein n=1 Tax=Fictibacillus sp. NRS-1165 TaxID=3144463 RepID=UPI003D2352DB
ITLTLITIIISDRLDRPLQDGAAPRPTVADKKEPEQNVTEKDVQTVENMTRNLLNNFKEGQTRTPGQITDITEQIMSKDFFENTYTVEFQKERWLGMYGLGSFYDEEVKTGSTPLSTETAYVKGEIKQFEIADIQKDQNNNTITTYIRYDAFSPNEKEWIEWRDIPGEGWKINAVSFNANIEDIEINISPKKEWE